MAPMQKRAWWGLILGLVIAAALVAVFVIKGDVTRFDDDPGFRYIVYALWIGGLLVHIALMGLLRKPNQVDERDRAIMERASKTQVNALIIMLVVWSIALTEAYWSARAVPVVYLTIIFISSQVVNAVAQSLGIIIGYWRMERGG